MLQSLGLRKDPFRTTSDPSVPPFWESHRAHVWEQYRVIRTKILHHSKEPAAIVVSSPGVGDGKTLTAINLATVFALKGEEQVLLLDADLRAPAVHTRFEVAGTPGLAEILAGVCRLEQALLRIKQLPNLYILPAGKPLANPTDLLDSRRWHELISRLRKEFRLILDSPPAEGVADYDLIAAESDGVVLVVRPDHTNRTACIDTLNKVRNNLVGVVVNEAVDSFLWKGPPPYYYRHRESSSEQKPQKLKA